MYTGKHKSLKIQTAFIGSPEMITLIDERIV